MLKFLTAIAATVAVSGSTYSPVWSEYDTLICIGDKMLSCSGSASSCKEAKSLIEWQIEFDKMRLVYLKGDVEVGLAALIPGDTEFPRDKVATQSGQMIVFDRVKDGNGGIYRGWMTSGHAPQALMQHELTCTGR